MPVRNFTDDQLPALLDLVEVGNDWGDKGRELGRQTFKAMLAQPGLAPEDNCLLLEETGEKAGRLQGFCLIFPELPIGRAVLELKVAPGLAGGSQERELVRRAVGRARDLGAGVVHLCQPNPSPSADSLREQGFSVVRNYWDMVWRQDSLPSAALPDGFTVRPFQPGDARLLTEVQNAAFAGSWGFCPNTVEQIEHRSSMANTSHRGIPFLYHGEQIAGYCWTFLSPVGGAIRGIIGMIGVAPDYRGRGISHSILLAGMEFLRSLDVADIGLQVDGDNTPAVRLYTSVGFRKAGELQWFELGLSPDTTPER